MSEKIVQRLPVRSDPLHDLVGVIDVIEFYLRFEGNRSARDCLCELLGEIRGSEGRVSQAGIDALVDVIGRLEKIENFMSENGFEVGARE